MEGVAKADAVFHNLVAEQKVPGISATILKEGQKVLQKGYGYAHLDKKTPIHPTKTIFRIASISKCITGLAFGTMVEEGILDWDDSLHQHLPYYPKKKYGFTLRQLAGHTAGIRGYRGKEFALNQPYSIKKGIKVFKDDPLVFEPDKGYGYNSFDFVLLSLAMQEASGIPFEKYVKEKVLDPLGMDNTFTPNEGSRSFRVKREILYSEFYSRFRSGFRKAIPVDNFYKLAGGGYLSTSEDIARLGQGILEQKLLLSETYQHLLTSQTIHGEPTYYGLGFQVSNDAQARPFVGHVGNSVGAYTNFYVYPKEKLVVSVLINCTDPKVQEELDMAIDGMLPSSFT